ncbi:hypothetical protein BYT27DRAFT_7197758 [Phlegmacium glaucopus]|nr:hypothetical protein BYT27DRAFT_7197758 [Phlegmacium glaucopus]
MVAIDIPKTFGALLIGGLFASLLSGFVVIQVIVYFKLYPEDHRRLKTLVLVVWLLDTGHTIAIWLSVWGYFIDSYGDAAEIDNIHKSLALSVIIPAMLTFLVHIFYAHRIFMLSRRNYILTLPIIILAILRLVSASTTTAFMLKLHTFTLFKRDVRWIFTTGLALSTSVDILITTSLCVLLQSSRTGLEKSNVIIDSLIMYTFETGALTCAGTIASMLCWSIIPNNLVFMGLHFVIGKLYANSLLVTLNTRESTREKMRHVRSNGSSGEHGVAVHIIDSRRRRVRDSDELVLAGVRSESKLGVTSKSQPLAVNIQQSVQYG